MAVATSPPRSRQMSVLGAIALGAALGGPARYALARRWPQVVGGFPWATLWTNVSGSFVLGLFLIVLVNRFPPTRFLRPFVATGFLGAYTTFSTFCVETDQLIADGHPATAVGYVAASLLLGLAAAWSGVRIAHAIPVPDRRKEQS